MAKNKKRKNLRSGNKREKQGNLSLSSKVKRTVWGILFFLLAIIIIFSFFDLSGLFGSALMGSITFLIGKTIFIIPLIFILSGSVLLSAKYKRIFFPLLLSIILIILGISEILEGISLGPSLSQPPGSPSYGGWIGYFFSLFLLKLFGFWIAQIISGAIILIGILIFRHLISPPVIRSEEPLAGELPPAVAPEEISKPSLIRRIFGAKFKVKEIEPLSQASAQESLLRQEIAEQPTFTPSSSGKSAAVSSVKYELPPLDLLEPERGAPSSGDIRGNSAIIKKTLQNFDIPVEMSEINIGPTVTQYTLKPAEGVKLSKITALANDLSLALASHPIRIEAPVPGRSLVGIEIPNKVRARVRLRNLISHSGFQSSASSLTLALGKDVSGLPVCADLARMPHLLVAGSTGTGKTIFLNSVLLSALYKNSPETLRLILIDPKRVEFPIYQDLPHLLAPVIYNAGLTCNALKWLIGEMERRFDVLSEAKERDIMGFNESINNKNQNSKGEYSKPMPYIILVIDELADLMAAKGREIEAAIVRLAQMARAVGIHLIVATQRPSVEVITGLIKANITSRVTFQVASQVDSRTVLDMAGAEKLLGSGDLLYISAEIAKPRRIQGAYVSEKEVRKVVNWIKAQHKEPDIEAEILENELEDGLKKRLETPEIESENFYEGEDYLYEEAKKVVVEAKKASASLLQRRLRIGYARAARILDILEEKGVVGPGEGAKPREVYLKQEEASEDTWKKV